MPLVKRPKEANMHYETKRGQALVIAEPRNSGSRSQSIKARKARMIDDVDVRSDELMIDAKLVDKS